MNKQVDACIHLRLGTVPETASGPMDTLRGVAAKVSAVLTETPKGPSRFRAAGLLYRFLLLGSCLQGTKEESTIRG